MKISNSKKELARIISENGGWRDGAEFSAIEMNNGDVRFCKEKPQYRVGIGIFSFKDFAGIIEGEFTFPNWHQCILSREEYFHLYPVPDADGWIEWNGGDIDIDDMQLVDYKMACTPDEKYHTSLSMNLFWDKVGEPQDIIAYRLHKPEKTKPEYCEAVTRSIQEPESKPTFEQLAADYRNKLDYANRKQEAADNAKAASAAALSELEKAIAAIGFAITPIDVVAQEPELVITDWRDLQIGDVIFVGGYDLHEAGEGEVINMEPPDYDYDYAVEVMTSGGVKRWIDVNEMWSFVRRPAK